MKSLRVRVAVPVPSSSASPSSTPLSLKVTSPVGMPVPPTCATCAVSVSGCPVATVGGLAVSVVVVSKMAVPETVTDTGSDVDVLKSTKSLLT